MKFVGEVDFGALAPEILEAYASYVKSFWDHGKLDPQIKELIRMRSAVNADCKQ
jgi:hypothetical protein